MAHTFDSGLASAQRTLVRDAVINALADLRKPSKYLASIVELPAPVRFGSDDEAVLADAIQGQAPAVALAIGDRSFTSRGNDNLEWVGECELHVYACSQHERSLMARMKGDVVSSADDTADPGLDVIGEHVFERLAGLPLTGSRGGIARPLRESVAYVGEDWTVLEQVYAVETFIEVNPNRAITKTATSIYTTHTESAAGDPADREALTPLDAP